MYILYSDSKLSGLILILKNLFEKFLTKLGFQSSKRIEVFFPRVAGSSSADKTLSLLVTVSPFTHNTKIVDLVTVSPFTHNTKIIENVIKRFYI